MFDQRIMDHLARARVLWRGPSKLTGEEVVAIAIPDSNPKTAKMLYTYVLVVNTSPVKAAYNGADEAVCGDCKFRALLKQYDDRFPPRPCYVRLSEVPVVDHDAADEVVPPDVLWTAYHQGMIPADSSPDWLHVHEMGWIWTGPEPVRLGSYGDPAAAPVRVWSILVNMTEKWTGYTHQWNNPRTDSNLKELCMASVDSLAERAQAKAAGWRTFLVVPPDQVSAQELQEDIFCPMSAGKGVQCETCLLCRGTTLKTKSIWEKAHGPAAELLQLGDPHD
jgi:hypothetical protein